MIILLMMIYSCSYNEQFKDTITPVTYQDTPHRSADSIGKLRRLLIMPVEVLSYKGRYLSRDSLETAEIKYEKACVQFLTEKKGYNIITLRGADGKLKTDLLKDLDDKKILTTYKTWRRESPGKQSAEIIQNIGNIMSVDGVLVVWIKERRPWNAIDGILNIALMNIPLVYNMASPNIGALIYETSTGDLVWSEKQSTFIIEPDNYTDSIVSLFTDLENAVPLQLIKE